MIDPQTLFAIAEELAPLDQRGFSIYSISQCCDHEAPEYGELIIDIFKQGGRHVYDELCEIGMMPTYQKVVGNGVTCHFERHGFYYSTWFPARVEYQFEMEA